LKAWLFTILRHAFYSHMRRAWREAGWDEHLGEQIPVPPDEQVWASELSDFVRGLDALPKHQREALLLTGVAGFSYGDTGKILKTPVGSVKSRAARGRGALMRYREGERRLPPRVRKPPTDAFDDILAQLTTLTPAGASAEWSAPPHEVRG
jgi:RNA polymerase sigma-70 factor (ECF subfamily)